MWSYKKKKNIVGNDIMELDLRLGNAKNTRKRKKYGKGKTWRGCKFTYNIKRKKEKPSKGAQQMATTKKENPSKQFHFIRTLEQLTSIVATSVMVAQVTKVLDVEATNK